MIKSIEEGRKEDGNRSIADKIIKRLHDLEKTVLNNYGRWAWELLQNAKDSVADTGRKVSVQIIYNHDKIEFLHNGNHFTEKDIRGLINQISSKEVEEGEVSTRTGRFGTGFLTTHLLSKEVYIKGIVETIGGDLFQFGFPLDRNGKTTVSLIPKIENAWKEFHASTENSEIDKYNEDVFNTSFIYALDSDEQKDIAQIGVDEFTTLIPYVLSFIPEIYSVEIIDNVRDETTVFTNESAIVDGFKKIKKIHNGKPTVVRMLYATNGTVSIAVRAIQRDDDFEILSVSKIPKLFCDFPLIGTENFHFPIVVNSFYFNPQTERDGIWLMGDNDPEVIENKDLLEQALLLYKEMIDNIETKSFKNIFNIAKTKLPSTDEKYFDADWYTKYIQAPLRKFLLTKSIVELEDGSNGKLNELWFPLKSYTKEIKEGLWQYTSDLFPQAVCKKDSLHEWTELIWDDISKITFAELAGDIAKSKSIGKLSESLGNDEDLTFKWLNKIGSFINTDEINHPLFEKNAIVPNENGNFLIKSELFINQINDPDLIKILQLLGEDWNDILLHHKVGFGRYSVKKKSEIATKINEKLKNISQKNPNFIKAISLLSEWFDNNSEEGKELFSETYRKRAELFMNTIEDKDSLYKVMRSKTDLAHLSKVAEAIEENPRLFENIEQAKEIYSLLKQYNVNDLQQLRDLLDNQGTAQVEGDSLLPITQEILTNMGISSLEEWQDAIKDKDLASLFSHKSTPTTDMFVYVQSLIQKAKENIIEYLQTLEDYDLDDLDDTTASTILAGILKDGRTISIVARPAYNGEVIIYYGSERDILDYEPSELWIDDGIKPRMISLGHLLKKAQIVKFPI
ncbi:MAG: sacsin N-terminal ATP-binding-like domain-containing protein [Candidatus Saccharimonadaceae bacterium]